VQDETDDFPSADDYFHVVMIHILQPLDTHTHTHTHKW